MLSVLAEALTRCSVIQMDLDTESLPSFLLPTSDDILSYKIGSREKNSVFCRGVETFTLNLRVFCGGDTRGEMGLKINIFLESFLLHRETYIL